MAGYVSLRRVGTKPSPRFHSQLFVLSAGITRTCAWVHLESTFWVGMKGAFTNKDQVVTMKIIVLLPFYNTHSWVFK